MSDVVRQRFGSVSHIMLRSRQLRFLQRIAGTRQLHASAQCQEKLFDADRVRQYEKLHKVPDKESALQELDNLGKPGGRSVVEFFFGENNAAAVISSVNTIKHPPVADDELLLFASRMPARAKGAAMLAWLPGSYGLLQAALNVAEVGLMLPWWQIGMAGTASAAMVAASWRANRGDVAAMVLTNGGTHVRIHHFGMLGAPTAAGVTIPVPFLRTAGLDSAGRISGGGSAGHVPGSPLSRERLAALDKGAAAEPDTTELPLKKAHSQAGAAAHELVPVLGQGNGTTAFKGHMFFEIKPPSDTSDTPVKGVLGKQMLLDFKKGLGNIFSYHDSLLELVLRGKPVSIPAWKAAVDGVASLGNPAAAAEADAVTAATSAAASRGAEQSYWKAAVDNNGRTYYYHELTRETRWDKPSA